MKTRVLYRLTVAAMSAIVIVALGCDTKASPQERGATATYMQFRSLLLGKNYSQAFDLMDDTARQEFRAATTAVLGMAGVPSSKLRDMSDFDIFKLFMSHQTPHEFDVIAEKIDGDITTLDGRITQDAHEQSVTIKMKKHGNRWLVHSTGVAIGE